MDQLEAPRRCVLNHATQHWYTGNTRKHAISVRPGPRVYESHVDRFRRCSCKDFAVHAPLTTREKGQTPEAHELQSSLFAGLAHPFPAALSTWTLRLCAIVISFAARSCARRLRILPPPRQWTVATCLQSVCTRSILPKADRPGGTWARRGPDMPKHKKLHGPGQRTQPPSGPGREAWPSGSAAIVKAATGRLQRPRVDCGATRRPAGILSFSHQRTSRACVCHGLRALARRGAL